MTPTPQSPKTPPPPSASQLAGALADLGVTHAVGLPDTSLGMLFRRLEDGMAIRTVGVTREGEAFAVAAGLWMGGATPVVLVQNTGLLEAGDALRGTAVRMGVPLLCLVSYRGYAKMTAAGLHPFTGPATVDVLTRPDLDSAALLTEPTLTAWGIPSFTYASTEDLPRVAEAWDHAHREGRPVALLLAGRLAE